MRVPAIRITQSGTGDGKEAVTIYVTALTLAQLSRHQIVDTWGPANDDGYQRPPEVRRFRDIARYVTEQEGILPTRILVAVRSTDAVKPTPTDFDDMEPVSTGFLDIPSGARFWVVDGQHRFNGVNDAFTRSGDPQLGEYPFPVSIMWDVEQYSEMKQFNIINSKQKKMSTDIVDRHLVNIQEREGIGMIARGSSGEKDYLRASTTKLVDKLNAVQGTPWFHQISIPGVAGRDGGLVRQHAFVASLEPVMKDSWIRQRPDDDDKVRIIANFWRAAARAWPEAFAEPKSYRVQTTVGIYALHTLLPVLLQRCLESRDFTEDRMTQMLSGMGLDSSFWHREDGDPRTLGTGMSSIRLLAHFLVAQLPAPTNGDVKI